MHDLKISYSYAIHLILLLIIFSILSTSMFEFLLKTIPYLKLGPVISIIKYSLPFIFLFGYVYLDKQNKKIIIKKSYELFKAPILDIYISSFLMMFFTIIIIQYLIELIPKEGTFLGPLYRSFDAKINEQLRYPISFFIISVLLAPFCEEFFFRGILLEGLLNNGISPLKGILFSSFLFGAIHMNPWQFIGAFLAGSVMGLIYFRIRSIFICLLLHALNNWLSFSTIFFYKEKYLSQWIQSKDFILWIAVISFTITLRWFIYRIR